MSHGTVTLVVKNKVGRQIPTPVFTVAFTGIYQSGKYSSSGKYWQTEFFLP